MDKELIPSETRQEEEEKEEDDDDDGFFCDVCDQILEPTDVRYRCEECDFDCCNACLFNNEETSPHPEHELVALQPQKIAPAKFVIAVDAGSLPVEENGHAPRRQVLVGNYGACIAVHDAAVRGEQPPHGIRSVLSLVDLPRGAGADAVATDSDTRTLYSAMSRIYGKDTVLDDALVGSGETAVYFHLERVPDVMDPATLAAAADLDNDDVDDAGGSSDDDGDGDDDLAAARAFLCTCALFIDARLQHGSVLVHCEKGQRRSPTALLAWLLSSPHAPRVGSAPLALRAVGRLRSEDGEAWRARYERTRARWLVLLSEWAQIALRRQWQDRWRRAPARQLQRSTWKRSIAALASSKLLKHRSATEAVASAAAPNKRKHDAGDGSPSRKR